MRTTEIFMRMSDLLKPVGKSLILAFWQLVLVGKTVWLVWRNTDNRSSFAPQSHSRVEVVLYGLSYPFTPPIVSESELVQYTNLLLSNANLIQTQQGVGIHFVACSRFQNDTELALPLGAKSLIELFARNPQRFLALHRINWNWRVRKVFRIFKNFFTYIKDPTEFEIRAIVELDKLLCLEFLIFSINDWFDENSMMARLQPYRKSFKTIMVHYSENTFDFESGTYQLGRLTPDIHVVWTSEYQHLIQSSFPESTVLALGPQLFRVPNLDATRSSMPKTPKLLTIFDVTPSPQDQFGPYLTRNAIATLDMIVHVFLNMNLREKNYRLVLKSKRPIRNFHDQQYLIEIDRLVNQGLVTLLPWHTDTFELVKSSEMILTFLGTSPALVARRLGKPVAYVDASNHPRQGMIDYGIPTLSTGGDLHNFIEFSIGLST